MLDKNSIDDTANIVRSHGAKLYTIPYTDIMTDGEYDRVFNQAMVKSEIIRWIQKLSEFPLENNRRYLL